MRRKSNKALMKNGQNGAFFLGMSKKSSGCKRNSLGITDKTAVKQKRTLELDGQFSIMKAKRTERGGNSRGCQNEEYWAPEGQADLSDYEGSQKSLSVISDACAAAGVSDPFLLCADGKSDHRF